VVITWLKSLRPHEGPGIVNPRAHGRLGTPFIQTRVEAPPSGRTRILFVNQYYWPSHASTAQHLADLVESLAKEGYECHVLCGQGGYKPGTPPLPLSEVHRDVHIHRVPTTSLGRRSTLTRMIDYLSFYVRALFACLLMPRYDAVVTLSTPPIIGLLGTLLRRLKGTRHVYWSMDLHPDASVALGKMSPRNPIVAFLAWLSNAVYRQADRVVVLGDYMAARIVAKGVPEEKIESIPVWSRREEIYPLPRAEHPLREKLGLADKFVAMYSGNLGLAHTFEEFIEAARRLRDRTDIVFLFVGEGPRLAEVISAKERDRLDNIQMLDYFPREQLHISLSIADTHLISVRPEMAGIVVPGKLYGAMASGRPALFVGPERSESADTIREAGCGMTILQGDVDSLVNAILQLAENPDLASRLGQKGREVFLTTYEKNACCEQWSELIGSLLPVPHESHVSHPVARQVAGGSA